jgi:ribokinase
VRIAVIGHVEWVEFLRVERVPAAGEIVRAARVLDVPAGGGAVAAVQLARWGADTLFFTALGDDELGHRALAELRGRGVAVHAAMRDEPQRRAITLVDAQRERTILVVGNRLVAHRADALPWDELATCDAIYVTGCDAAALQAARAARVIVATTRVLALLNEAGVLLDAVVGSDNDPAEVYRDGDLSPAPRLVVRTQGARGGTFQPAGGARQAYAPVPATVRGDTYGAGDTFAAALTYALGEQRAPADATALAATRSAEVLAFDGPYPP